MTFFVRLAASVLICSSFASASYSQLLATDPDWKESEAPAPTALNLKALVPFEVVKVSNLSWALDASAVNIVGDGLVRYVAVARSASGTLNALYEVINCSNGEVKTYARIISKEAEVAGKAWVIVADPKWISMYDAPSKHALALAKQGVCTGNTAAQTVNEILVSLKKTTIVFKDKSAP